MERGGEGKGKGNGGGRPPALLPPLASASNTTLLIISITFCTTISFPYFVSLFNSFFTFLFSHKQVFLMCDFYYRYRYVTCNCFTQFIKLTKNILNSFIISLFKIVFINDSIQTTSCYNLLKVNHVVITTGQLLKNPQIICDGCVTSVY